VLAVLAVASVASLALAPLKPTIERVRGVAPWTGLGLVVSEGLFVAGLAIMAWPVGVGIGVNPLRWRARFEVVVAGLNRTPAFWTGLAINTAGAAGSGLVVLVAIVVALPLSAWGLAVLPLADLSLTASVRAAIVAGVNRSAR
jgi:hypothetical protein